MAASVVVADILEQCAAIGDLHHALERVSCDARTYMPS